MRRMFSKTGASMGLHVGCKVTVALKLQRHLQSKPSVAPEPPKAAPVAPEPPKAGNRVLVSSRASDKRSSVKGSAKHGDQRRGGEYGNRRQEKLGASFGVLGKKTPFAAGDRNKQLSMDKIIDDVGEIKVVFTQRGKAQSPPLHPSPPPPPTPPSAPAPPTASQTSVSSSSASTQFAGGTGEKPSGVVNTGVVEGVEDDLFFNIARNTKAEGSQVSALLKSFGVLVDEEIENARALRPLVRPADISQDTDEKLKLNVVGGNEEERTVETVVDKEKLGSLSEEEAAGIEGHEIPHVIGGPANITAESMNTKEVPEDGGKIKHSVTTTDSKLEDRGGSSLSSDETPTPLLNDIMARRVPVEQAPLAPWTTKGRMNENESMPCARVSYDNVSHVASILLEEQPTHILSLVNFLHQTISVIDNHHTAAGTRTDVVFMTLPMVDFFKPKHGPLELTSGERVELLRAKERLLARMESASSRLRFVATAHGDMVEDFGAELFLACQHRVLLDTTHATFGFPSIQFGEFPAPSTVRRLSYFFGSQRCIEIAPKLHEYSVESIMNTGIIERKDVTAPSPPSFLLRLERRLLALVSRPTHREFLLRKLFFTTEFDTSTTMTSPNPLVKAWGEYSMSVIAQGNGTTNNNGLTTMRREETKPESIFGKLVYTSPAINAANVYALGCEMKRRVLPLLPSRCFITFRGEEMHQWEEKMKALVSAKDNCAVALLDCSQRCMDATLKMVKTHHDVLKGVKVVLIGEEHVAQPVLSTLPCGVVVSCASPYRVSSLGALQEVRLFAREKCPKETSDTILTAALTYLQKEEKPYVVCRGPCSKRLIASLVTEACRLTQQCDVASIDRAATDVLHLLVGPFHLIDYFGPVAVLRMLNETGNMNTQNNPLQVDCLPAIARHTLQCMSTDGYLGVNSRRGGFFSYREDGTPIALNTEVLRRYFSRYLSDTVVADRLLAVVVNECCELILSGHVLSATDANALTIAAIGFQETTGGALALADTIGISTLVQKMEDMSNWYGPHLRPSSLLKCMAHSKVSFASLSDAMIQSARM